MTQYEITINETIAHSVVVNADSVDEAVEQALETIVNGDGKDVFTESLGTNKNGAVVVEIKN